MQPAPSSQFRRLIAAALAVWGPGAATLCAQTSSDDSLLQRQRFLNEQTRKALDRELPTADKFSLDVGGWLDFYVLSFSDGDQEHRTLKQSNFRVYGGLTLDRGVHQAYARVRTTYNDWNSGDVFDTPENDLDGPNLERGWYQFDLRRAFEEYQGTALPFDLTFKIGRDFAQIGTGYALSLTLDQVQLISEWQGFETTFIAGRTPKSTDNIDQSPMVDDQSERDFWIIQERYKGFDGHQPFVFLAYQRDHTEEDPIHLLQNFQYDSQYLGFGMTGELIRNLRYSTEWVIERGTSYGDRRFLFKDNIRAWAFDNILEYYFDHRMQPRLIFEYMFASGDQNRLGSPTDAIGGNRRDNTDKSFVGFGYRDTGLAFAPRLSNIHIWRFGGAFRPFPDVDAVRDLELGTDWFLYAKHRSDAAVSDPLADRQSAYLGWEMDYFANYRITSDLAWTIRYGLFFPGKAFSDQEMRSFFLSGVTWSF